MQEEPSIASPGARGVSDHVQDYTHRPGFPWRIYSFQVRGQAIREGGCQLPFVEPACLLFLFPSSFFFLFRRIPVDALLPNSASLIALAEPEVCAYRRHFVRSLFCF